MVLEEWIAIAFSGAIALPIFLALIIGRILGAITTELSSVRQAACRSAADSERLSVPGPAALGGEL